MEKVSTLHISKLVRAIGFLSAENVDEMVPILEDMTCNEIDAMEEAKASKDETKSNAGKKGGNAKAEKAQTASTASKPATPPVSEPAAPVTNGKENPVSVDDAAMMATVAESITDNQLVELFKNLPVGRLVAAFKKSEKKGYKITKHGETA